MTGGKLKSANEGIEPVLPILPLPLFLAAYVFAFTSTFDEPVKICLLLPHLLSVPCSSSHVHILYCPFHPATNTIQP